MGRDITAEFRTLVKELTKRSSSGERKGVDTSILRPVRRQTDFAKAVVEVSSEIKKSRRFVEDQRHRYIIPGVISDEERDKIEQEIVAFIKICSTSVEHLSRTVAAVQEKKLRMEVDISEQAIAHRHGMVLIISEELRELTLLLDKYRSEHAMQLRSLSERRQRQQAKQEAKLKQMTRHKADALPSSSRNDSPQLHEAGTFDRQMIQEESQALFEELTHLSDRVHGTEKMMQEIATLNQMLSTQIMSQAEQIEQIYSDAVQSSLNMERGNKHLTKALDLNSSTRKYVLVILIVASFVLLFFDRFYS